MKIRTLLPVFILILLVPMITLAFSWKSIMFWQKPAPVKQIKKLNTVEKLSVEEKFTNWENAFNKQNFSSLKKNADNLTISEAELNYIATKSLTQTKNPPIQNLKIYLHENEAEITGYLLKPFKGEIVAKIKLIYKDEKLYPSVTYAKYKKLRLPTSIANKLIKKNLQQIINKLYLDNDLNDLQVILSESQLEIKF